MRLFLNIIICSFAFSCFPQSGWQPVSSFGSNPGNLAMYAYAPASLPVHAPLVVVMHGCTQTATVYAAQSGWNTLADQHQFYTVYPEQNAANNSSSCFNWFLAGDQDRGQGEALSIRQMVDYMKMHYSIDSTRIFVTGLSAGACMTNVMMASYPEVFQKGAVMAGVPFKAATTATAASTAMGGFVVQTPTQWGNLVRNENATYTGPFPKVAVFHGSIDPVVNINNVTEEVKQWTNVHNTDQTADLVQSSFNGNALVTKNTFNDASNQPVVETYTISGMGHAIAVDPGACYQQGGSTGTYAVDANFYSSFWAACFFNILSTPYAISGTLTVSAMQNGVSYSVPLHSGSTYTWTVPAGATIVSGQGTNSIVVNFGNTPGQVSVSETDLSGCITGPVSVNVAVGVSTGIAEHAGDSELRIYYNRENRTIHFYEGNKACQVSDFAIYDITGRCIASETLYLQSYPVDASVSHGLYVLHAVVNGVHYARKIWID
ncbi:MAG: PHB depolymerase family esterase [Bacteroidetes bacterium]|nr:PHB depolymerase family esterase [Bacteroidota bacterium]